MNIQFKYLTIILSFCLVITSCREESDELIEAEENQILESSSNVANLMLRTVKNDGSKDDIIDGTSCLSIALPVTVVVNGSVVTVVSENDFETIEDILTDNDATNEEDVIEYQFPITIILSDFTEIEVNDQNQLDDLIVNCEEQDEEDTIVCIDFQYPFMVSVFDTSNELIETITFNNDRQLYLFLVDLQESDIVNLSFPISVILNDDTVIVIDDLDALENSIEGITDDCDGFDDDSIDLFVEVITEKSLRVQKFKDDQSNETMNYKDYTFDFSNDGTVTIILTNEDGTSTIDGNWSVITSDEGNLEATFDFGSEIPLDKLSRTWKVKKIQERRIMMEDDDADISKDELFFQQLNN